MNEYTTINEQTIYINMDDSGVLVKGRISEPVFVYGGIVFLSKDEKDNFIRQYSSLVNKIKPKYCSDFQLNTSLETNYCLTHSKDDCLYKCPELKSSVLEPSDKRRFLNLIKKYNCSVAVVDNSRIYDRIVCNKASRGRFKDYVTKRLIKEIVKQLISENKINPEIPVKLILNLDEQTTKSNGYYDLKSSIIEELQYGITNYNYDTYFTPTLNEVSVSVRHQNSYNSLSVQAADLIVGEIRHKRIEFLENKDFNLYSRKTRFVDTIIYIP